MTPFILKYNGDNDSLELIAPQTEAGVDIYKRTNELVIVESVEVESALQPIVEEISYNPKTTSDYYEVDIIATQSGTDEPTFTIINAPRNFDPGKIQFSYVDIGEYSIKTDAISGYSIGIKNIAPVFKNGAIIVPYACKIGNAFIINIYNVQTDALVNEFLNDTPITLTFTKD